MPRSAYMMASSESVRGCILDGKREVVEIDRSLSWPLSCAHLLLLEVVLQHAARNVAQDSSERRRGCIVLGRRRRYRTLACDAGALLTKGVHASVRVVVLDSTNKPANGLECA